MKPNFSEVCNAVGYAVEFHELFGGNGFPKDAEIFDLISRLCGIFGEYFGRVSKDDKKRVCSQ